MHPGEIGREVAGQDGGECVVQPLPEAAGFGRLLVPDWIRSQPHHDPDNILADL